ncbi:hypothetical protein Tco_1482333 [Tanacetum coccineum]
MTDFPKSFPLVHKDRLLCLFNQEVGEDVARVREYRGVAYVLKIAMRRREECIGELKALGDCEGVAETMRFMERMQLDDIDKCNRSLLLMKEMEDKAREKSRLARQINALCDTLTKVIKRKENFVAELDMWLILGREFKRRARERNLFIEKLKGNMDY